MYRPDEPDRCSMDWHEQANASHDVAPVVPADPYEELWLSRRYPEDDGYGAYIPGTLVERGRA